MPNILDNFNLQSKKFIDSRQSFKTIPEMQNYSKSSLPEGMITYCEEDKNYYSFSNGKWEIFTGGDGTQGLYSYDEDSKTLEIAPLTGIGDGTGGGGTIDIDTTNLATKTEVEELKAIIEALQAEIEVLKGQGGAGEVEISKVEGNTLSMKTDGLYTTGFNPYEITEVDFNLFTLKTEFNEFIARLEALEAKD